MDLKSKVTKALKGYLVPEHIHLEDDDGLSGFVVSKRFNRLPALARQSLIDEALHQPSVKFSQAEQRQILMIAGLTPLEYEALGNAAPANGK